MTVTWNPSDKSVDVTLSNGDLTATNGAVNTWRGVRATESKSSGKWYCEFTVGSLVNGDGFRLGIATVDGSLSNLGDAHGYGYEGDGDKRHSSSEVAYGNTYTVGDIISMAFDLDNGKIWWAKNGVWQASGNPASGTNEAYSGISGTFFPQVTFWGGSDAVTVNFGMSAFSHSIPSGFSGLDEIPLLFIDLKTEIAADPTTEFADLLSDIRASTQIFHDLKSSIEATFTTKFVDLCTELNSKALKLTDLLSDIKAGNISLTDLSSEITAKAQTITDLNTYIRAIAYNFKDLNTAIEVIRCKHWLKTEIKAGCVARWYYTTEWNPNRFLKTSIEAKKPYSFSFNIRTGLNYAMPEPEIEILVPDSSFPMRTLFLDYLKVGTTNTYDFQLWWARGLSGKDPLRNAKIKAEYIDTRYANGYEVVTLNWISLKVGDGEYNTVNEEGLLLNDIPCDSKIDIALRVECRDCSFTRGLAFFRLIVTGDFREALYGGPIIYRDGSNYHSGEFDDYQSDNFICRLYIVE